MSTQFDTSIVDLDRTDELPVLDVEAYEARLAANEKSLSRTDAWAVEGSRVLDEPDDEPADAVPLRAATKPSVQAEALTTHVERILRRIAELEAEIVGAHETSAGLQKDCETLRAERAQKEQQLCERAESIAALEQSISNEKDIAAHVSQQLAAKLMECEKATSIIKLRDRTIEDLNRDFAELNQQLQQQIAASADLTARLAAAEQSVNDSHALLLQHEQKDVELAQLRDELAAARAEVQSQAKLLKEGTDELGRLRSKLAERDAVILGFDRAVQLHDEQTEDLMTQLHAARDERDTMSVQVQKARAREKNLTEQIFSKNNQIAALQADLAVHTEALATIQRDVSRIGHHADAELDEVEHVLEPVEHEGPTLHLTGEVLTVGRTSDNNICIPSHLISRCHARLLVGPTGVIVEDANSTNGCFVNGEQIRQHLLRDGDVLEMGDMRYRLRTRLARDVRAHDNPLGQLSSLPRRTEVRIAN